MTTYWRLPMMALAILLASYPAFFFASGLAPGASDSGAAKWPVVWVNDENMTQDPQTGLFVVTLPPMGSLPHSSAPPPEIPNGGRGTVAVKGEAGDLLRRWLAEGAAAGNVGDFYDNHDGGHSKLPLAEFPQMTAIEFGLSARKQQLHLGLQCRLLYDRLTIGNSSMANVSGPYWRSLPRAAYADPRLLAVLYGQYLNNHLYVYPEHRDHDPGHNGPDGYGDVFCTNTPFVIISQGSSGSDRPFLQALAMTLAAFQPETKQRLIELRQVAPALQLILRSCLRSVADGDDYLTGKAHPTVFRGEDVDALKMIQMAHDMSVASLPPAVRLKVREEEEAVVGRDYFEIGPREHLLTSPTVVARIVCSTQHRRRMVLSAEDSRDPAGRPLTWHWSVLRGDAARIEIRPLNEQQSVVELLVPYHTRRPVAEGSNLESNRVDIGAFVHNGQHYSAPAFVTLFYLDDETRVYAPDGRILSVDYRAAIDGGNYVDPVVHALRTWRDDYHYDDAQRLIGWTRSRGEQREEFTADGALVTQRDEQGRPTQARSVKYVGSSRRGVVVLDTQPGDEILHYQYDSPDDRVGCVQRREEVSSS